MHTNISHRKTPRLEEEIDKILKRDSNEIYFPEGDKIK